MAIRVWFFTPPAGYDSLHGSFLVQFCQENQKGERALGKYIRKQKRKPLLPVGAALLTVLVLAGVLSQTVYARTYVIRDGHRILTYTTFATDPAEVLGEAGLELREHDTYTSQDDAITIRRGQQVTVSYYGKRMEVKTFGETVGGLLTRLGLTVAHDDVLSHPMSADTSDGMEIRVDRVVSRREVFTTAVPHETSYCSDATLPEGEEKVLVPGSDGEILCTADVTYVNGEEKERQVLSQTVTAAPVTEVIALGTAARHAPEEPGDKPIIADGYITLPTGEVLTYTHTAQIRATAYTHTDAGCDFITATGTTVHRGTVAVDPRYIPYGTRMFIVSNDGEYVYGISVAEDCGGDIKGDRMDLYFPTFYECIQFGRRNCTIYFLG